jgi:hypothetical protein
MAVRRKSPDTKKTSLSSEDWSRLHAFAVAMEKGRFSEYISTLSNTRKLLWSNFLAGIARGLGAVIGATIIVVIIASLFAILGDTLPGKLGDFFSSTSDTIQQVPEPSLSPSR